MKWFIASDIHGSSYWCKKMLECFEYEKAERILLLGDILYHGPRNDLPKDYNPKAVIDLLNPLSEKILCVRGNCDSEVDQMVLSFPVMASYAALDFGSKALYATHGHVYNKEHPLPFAKGSVLLCGHTHVPCHIDCESFIYVNPGSVSIPKENSLHSYMTYDGKEFLWKDIETKNVYDCMEF